MSYLNLMCNHNFELIANKIVFTKVCTNCCYFLQQFWFTFSDFIKNL